MTKTLTFALWAGFFLEIGFVLFMLLGNAGWTVWPVCAFLSVLVAMIVVVAFKAATRHPLVDGSRRTHYDNRS